MVASTPSPLRSRDAIARTRVIPPIDIAAVLASHVATSSEAAGGGALRTTAWKLLCRTGAVGATLSASAAAANMASAVRGALSRGGVSAEAAAQGILSLYEAPIEFSSSSGQAPHSVWVVIRDVDPRYHDAPTAGAGASGVLFVFASDGNAGDEASALRSLCCCVAPGAGLPLLVLATLPPGADAQAEGQRLATAICIADAVASSRGGIAFARVICVPPLATTSIDEAAGQALRASLVHGIQWLVSHTVPAPAIGSRPSLSAGLDAVVAAAVGVLLSRQSSADAGGVSPEACIAAFNAAVTACSVHVKSLYGLVDEHSVSDTQRTPLTWPPPEVPRTGATLPPYGWDAPSRSTAIASAISALLLPPWQSQSAPGIGDGSDDTASPLRPMHRQLSTYLMRVAQADGHRDVTPSTAAQLLASCDVQAQACIAAAGQHHNWLDVLAPLLYQRMRRLDADESAPPCVVYLPPTTTLAAAAETAARAAVNAAMRHSSPIGGTPGSAAHKRKADDAVTPATRAFKQRADAHGSRSLADENAQPAEEHAMDGVVLSSHVLCAEPRPDASHVKMTAWDAAAAVAVGAERAAAEAYDNWLAATAFGGGGVFQSVPVMVGVATPSATSPLSGALHSEVAAACAMTEALSRAAAGSGRTYWTA